MKNCEKSQILMLSLIAILLIVTPLLSSSVRTTYLYIITNLLIIALGAQAGVLRAFSKPIDHEKKNPVSVPQKPVLAVPSELASTEKRVAGQNDEDQRVASECSEKNGANKVVAKSKSQKVTGTVKMETVKKCPSMPSLFFIGGGEAETEGAHNDDDEVEDFYQLEEDEDVADLSGQELLIKAETFIGNFYKQLKMQREESWKRIHGIYHKAF
ncbi:hypothetical protein RchiOBHm_Chr5g0040991 [Rosa chinensis]|uniref:DUF4408 domain-containing protein n=1 Tax=Rosa chinensis TaxID=74649 RepID=A0A2P6QCP6_ROSCH|nr:hypothetical protein RchiOBHm_Chr5g0040991 [Rosa chinensis]